MIVQTIDDTRREAATLARQLKCGDCVALRGDLGAGKTAFAGCVINQLSAQSQEVLSPTFMLVQDYPVQLGDGTQCQIFHYDLYRIESQNELAELAIDDALQRGVVLIEWPERAEGWLPAKRYDVTLRLLTDGSRELNITAPLERKRA